MNPAAMPYSTRRFLEWVNLVLAAFFFGVGLGSWLASPLRAGNGWSEFMLMLAFYDLPFVLLTSLLLLFVNERRAVMGLAMAVLSYIALSQVGFFVQ
jgi:hypothetical protein